MLNLFLVLAIPAWFTMLYPMVRRRLAVAVRPLDARLVLPMVLVCTFAFMPLVFTVPREDGNAVLEEGLSASNIITLVLTGLTGLYLFGKIALDRRVALLPFAMPYLPFTLMIGVNTLSAAWSIVPPYTLYRSAELFIFYHASIVIFDRTDIERRFADLLAIITLAWLASVTADHPRQPRARHRVLGRQEQHDALRLRDAGLPRRSSGRRSGAGGPTSPWRWRASSSPARRPAPAPWSRSARPC